MVRQVEAKVNFSNLRALGCTMEDCVGETPVVRLQRMVPNEWGSIVLCKLEGSFVSKSVQLEKDMYHVCKFLHSQ